jgi:CheY-like chemotaxis protein
MVPVIVILTIVVFILVDVVTRLVMKRVSENRIRKERQEALDIGLRLEHTEEAPTLKRVEVDEPKARILAVDDESVVLDGFRKILVLHGYAVDTVESGPEAVGLVQRNDYDFVFTDLKMPDYDGLEVTKAVKHLRPDIDVVMITGFATIESAVEAMKYGAMDYVQKPFTEDELVDFVGKIVHRRAARLEEEMPPKLHLLSSAASGSRKPHVINVAGGLFVTREHSWLGLEVTGELKVGVDDFCVKALEHIDSVELPRRSQKVRKGDPLFTLRSNGDALTFTSPVDGRVSRVNTRLADSPELLTRRPYQLGWICCLDAKGELSEMRRWTLGSEALSWYEQEIDRFRRQMAARETGQEHDAGEPRPISAWEVYRASFLTGKEAEDAEGKQSQSV